MMVRCAPLMFVVVQVFGCRKRGSTVVVPLGKFMLNGLVAIHLLLTSALSMMNIAVAPVSSMALSAAMVSAFKYCGIGVQNMVCAVAAIEGHRCASVV